MSLAHRGLWGAVPAGPVLTWVWPTVVFGAKCPVTKARHARDSAARLAKLSRFDVWQIVRWCRKEGSSHNLQRVVGGWMNACALGKAGLCQWTDKSWCGLCAMLLLQCHSQFQQTTSEIRREMMLMFCEATRGVGDIWESCPKLFQGFWTRSKMTEVYHRDFLVLSFQFQVKSEM